MQMIERYMSEPDVSKVYNAFLLAADAHNGITRKSGEPYIKHPLEVAGILADLHMDADTVSAALLHDVIEDTDYTKQQLAGHFGSTVADLVDGVTKLEMDKTYSTKQEVVIASFHKMMQTMTDDFRVVLIKLADRLHNMRTLGSMKPEARRRIAHETFTIYIPLARRMGMNAIRRELQLLAFQQLYPWRSRCIHSELQTYLANNSQRHNQILETVAERIMGALPGSAVFLWEKNLFTLYNRIKEHIKSQGGTFNINKEMLEVRILVRNWQDCYVALGLIHSLYHPQLGKFKDYIANPKTYGFQALQTVVLTPSRQLVRIQIQTREMYQVAQYGVAAQWRFPDMSADQKPNITQDALNRWLGQVRDLGDQSANPFEFFSYMQSDLNNAELSALTPKGEVKEFPPGSTLVDFAYSIHTDVGHHCIGALVDGIERPLRTVIPNHMAVIEVLTDPHATPQPSWLNFVKTARARSSIQSWLRHQTAEERLALGRQRLDISLHSRGGSFANVEDQRLTEVLDALHYKDLNEFYTAIGQGEQCSKLMAERLLGHTQSIETDKADNTLLIKGTSGLVVKMANCCLPLPRETIVAHQDLHSGLAIHRADCVHLQKIAQPDDILSVAWAEEMQHQKFSAGVVLEVQDVKGVLHNITRVLDKMDVNIVDLKISGDDRIQQDTLIIQVNDINHLQEVMRQLKHIPNVLSVNRLMSRTSHDYQNDHLYA